MARWDFSSLVTKYMCILPHVTAARRARTELTDEDLSNRTVSEEDVSGSDSLGCGCMDAGTADSMMWQTECIASAQEFQWQTSISRSRSS